MGENLDRNQIVLKNLPDKFRNFFFIRTAETPKGQWFCLQPTDEKFAGLDVLSPHLWGLSGSIDSAGSWTWDGDGTAVGHDGSAITLFAACGKYDAAIAERRSESVHSVYQPLQPTIAKYGDHCSEPYYSDEDDGAFSVIAGPFGMIPCSTLVCTISPELRNPKETAERIASCVNACAGVEPDAVPRLIEAVESAIEIIEDEDRDSCFDVEAAEILEEALLAAKPDAS